jgi:cell division transport system ATP-binding protein
MNTLENLVELKGVDIFNHNTLVLKKVDFSLYRGEFCYILGRTGSGKSSFLKAIYGASRVENGSAEVVEQNLFELDSSTLPYYRRKMGMVFQEIYLFEEMTVRENLDYILRATDWHEKELREKRIREVLGQLGMIDKIDSNVTQLSGGEQQTIAIGRAILNKPKLIIADEPTGNLDFEASESILLLLRDLALEYQASVILSTHDLALIKKFPSRSYLCSDGRMVEN